MLISQDKPFENYLATHALMRSSLREEAQDYLGKLFAPHTLEVHGDCSRLNFTHASAKLHQATLHFVGYGACPDGVSIVVPRMGDDLLLEFPLSGKAFVTDQFQTSVVEPGGVVVAPHGQRYVSRMTADYCQLALQIPMPAVSQAAGIDAAELRHKPISFAIGCAGSIGVSRLLTRLVHEVCLELESGDHSLSSIRVRRGLEQALLALVLDLPHNYQHRLQDVAAGVSPFYVKRAEEFIRSHLTEEIDLEDIVCASGVSKRSLHAGFRRFRGTTPLALLKRLRLEAAKSKLETAHRSDNSVTDVATEFGFFHLSKFARDFKTLFGVLPSEVLRQ